MRKRHYLPPSASYLKVKNPIHQRAPATLIDSILPCFLPMEDNTFEPDLIHAIFKLVWSRRALERQLTDGTDAMDCEVGGAGTSKKNRPTSSANGNALKLSCELLRNFITEAVQRVATIAEAEGVNKIEATHLERILPQLLLDF